jgi:hypothetical protein
MIRKTALFFSAFLLLLSNSDVSCNTVYTKTQLMSSANNYLGMAYDGSFLIWLQDNNYLIYQSTTLPLAMYYTIKSDVPFGPIVIYDTNTMVIDLQNGKYQFWAISSSPPATKNLAPEPDLKKSSNKMFYFHPDPLLYIQHTDELGKIYRYVINPAAGTLTPKADYASFDFGIGDLSFIEKTEKGFLGASASAINGYYQITYNSDKDGRTINTIPSYFESTIVGLSYSLKKKKFYVASGKIISVWDINDFTKPVSSRSIASNMLGAVFSYHGDLVTYVTSSKAYTSPVEYAKEIYSFLTSSATKVNFMMRTATDDFYWFLSCYNFRDDQTAYLFSVVLDPSCLPGFGACYCDTNSATPLLNIGAGTCVASCPNRVYLGTCVTSCPSDSTWNGQVCVPNNVCPPQCKSCINDNCAKCDTNQYLFSTTNTSTYDVCLHISQLKGFYVIKNDTDGTGIVKKCASGCIFCANLRKCLVCSA